MSNAKYLIASALLFLVVIAGVLHYFHWDKLAWLALQEQIATEQQRDASVWLSDYNVVIQAKQVKNLDGAELSGLTWHAPSNTLFAITGDKSNLIQLSLEGELLRKLELNETLDPESLEALSDGRFALVDERAARLYIFEVPGSGNYINLETALQFDLAKQASILLKPENKGIEGLVWDEKNSRFILAKERNPHKLFTLEFDLANDRIGKLKQISSNSLLVNDISGLALDNRSGNLLVLSHESHLLLELDSQDSAVSFISFFKWLNGLHKGIKQAEGVAIDYNHNIYIVGEPNLFYSFKPK